MIYKATGTRADGEIWVGVVQASNLVSAIRSAAAMAGGRTDEIAWQMHPIHDDDYGVIFGRWTHQDNPFSAWKELL